MYHISSTPNITKLEPRVPAYVPQEPQIPRVCAAPTIAGCLEALVELDGGVDYYIYRIEAEPDVNNESVVNWPRASEEWVRWGDACETGEVWYLEPVKCKLFGTMDCWGTIQEV